MNTRTAYYDNLKYLLMFGVVLAHFTFEYRSELFMISLGNALFAFIMPAFVFITGYLSRNYKRPRIDDVYKLIVPYIILEVIYLFYTKITHLGNGNKYFHIPTFQNWFLLALFYWRTLMPLFNKLDKRLVLLILFLVSFSAGFFESLNDKMALYRSLYYFPIYAIGYYSQDVNQKIEQLKKYKTLAIGMLLTFLSFIFYVSYQDKALAEKLLYAYTPMLGYLGDMQNILWRSIATVSGMTCGFLILFAIPSKDTFFTKYGRNTLYVYLFHMFILLAVVHLAPAFNGIVSIMIVLVFSVLITWILSLDAVSKLLNPIVDPARFIASFKKKR